MVKKKTNVKVKSDLLKTKSKLIKFDKKSKKVVTIGNMKNLHILK